MDKILHRVISYLLYQTKCILQKGQFYDSSHQLDAPGVNAPIFLSWMVGAIIRQLPHSGWLKYF